MFETFYLSFTRIQNLMVNFVISLTNSIVLFSILIGFYFYFHERKEPNIARQSLHLARPMSFDTLSRMGNWCENNFHKDQYLLPRTGPSKMLSMWASVGAV